MPQSKPSDEMSQRSIRLPASLWARVEAHAAKLAAAAGGSVRVTVNAAVMDVLHRNLPPLEKESSQGGNSKAGPATEEQGSSRHPAKVSLKAASKRGTPKR
jgi:hypothetical protein